MNYNFMMKKQTWSKAGAIVAITLLCTSAGIAVAASAPADPPAGGTLQQRVDQRKQEQAITLSANDQKRIVSNCVLSQAKVRAVQTATVNTVASYTKVYGVIDANLWGIVGQLKLAGKDTYVLEKDHLDFVAKVAAFQATATNYQQSLDDTVLMNCSADPVGFESLVFTARAYYAQLRSEADGINDNVVNVIKPELSAHTTDLQSKAASGGN